MKRLAALTLIGTFALAPAIAEAGKIHHRGQIVGDDQTSVTLNLTKNKGRITKVSRFKAVGVFTRCDSGDTRFEFTALNPTRVTKKGNFKERLKNPDGDVLRIKGTVKRKGKSVIGYVSTSEFNGSSAGNCQTPKQKFKTTKK